ncbi:MAG: hypothetical protein ACR2FV_16465 [Ornithinimicrobium sp.]|jgi:hypothetical protein|uniref:hypothetical protein n=1 Tax=Ornithinimicrobium sp. TaxID=1977084 RepID=UPI001818FD31|nr:hypothetical protein [Actinomycetota bacterium]
MPQKDPIADEGAQIVPFPVGHETPQTTEVEVDGEPVTIIYLPWRHEVDGEQRPAGLYYRTAETAGFYPDPTARDLDALLEEMVPRLRTHLHLVREPEEPSTS